MNALIRLAGRFHLGFLAVALLVVLGATSCKHDPVVTGTWSGHVVSATGDSTGLGLEILEYVEHNDDGSTDTKYEAYVTLNGVERAYTTDVSYDGSSAEVSLRVTLYPDEDWVAKGRIQDNGTLFGICLFDERYGTNVHGVWRASRVRSGPDLRPPLAP